MKKILPHMYKGYKDVWTDEAEMMIFERKMMGAKPILQVLWHRWYKEIEPYMSKNGLNVEVGAGSGYAGTYFKNLIQTDVVLTPHINICIDALGSPFKDSTLDSIVMIGVLHHLKNVAKFFDEAKRVLKPGGKIIMVEPYISLLSYPVWKLLHYEGCDLGTLSCSSDEYARIDANLAIPTILFSKKKKEFLEEHPDLKIIHESYHTAFHFFAAGGVSYPSLVPNFLVPVLVKVEDILKPLQKWLGSFMTVIIQKNYV